MTVLRARIPALVVAFAVATPAAFAADTKAAWDPIRTTFPTSTSELKALQESVKHVVEKTTPATVGRLSSAGELWGVATVAAVRAGSVSSGRSFIPPRARRR